MLTTRNVESLTVALVAAQRAKDIGQRIREQRSELHLTQSEVADKISDLTGNPAVTKDYVSRWERGENEPDEKNLEALAKVLETKASYLIAGSPEKALAADWELPPGVEERLRHIEEMLEALSGGVPAPEGALSPPARSAAPSDGSPDGRESASEGTSRRRTRSKRR